MKLPSSPRTSERQRAQIRGQGFRVWAFGDAHFTAPGPGSAALRALSGVTVEGRKLSDNPALIRAASVLAERAPDGVAEGLEQVLQGGALAQRDQHLHRQAG